MSVLYPFEEKNVTASGRTRLHFLVVHFTGDCFSFETCSASDHMHAVRGHGFSGPCVLNRVLKTNITI